MKTIGLLSLAAILSMGVLGCGSDPEPAPEFKDGSGQGEWFPEQVYADGPYGFEVGSTVENFNFVGYPNYVGNGAVLPVNLAHFYNPTGNGVYPAGSPYGEGQPKPRALVMLISSVWCGPCNQEAASILPGHYSEYKPMGGQFLTVLIDGPTPGDPATWYNLESWANTYNIDYSVVLDPAEQVMPLYEAAFPGNMIIRTSDMKIIEVVAGVPPQSFWNTYESVLDGSYVGP